jgi:hypothetical protein
VILIILITIEELHVLIQVVAKLFESVLLDIFSAFLLTDDLQFGFKANS